MRVLTLAFLVLTATPLFAQSSQPDLRSSQSGPRTPPDFLFGRPDWSIGLRGSWLLARKQSDWYDFVTNQLTLDRGDFNAASVGFDVGVALTSRADLVIGFDFSQTTLPSEYRDFVDNFRLPIEQQTRMREASLTGGVRLFLTERGRQVGNFAWVPRTVVPYVGAGAGLVRFDVRQTGDFVDFVDHSVFFDVFRAFGWTPSAHLLGGVDIHVFRTLYVTFDGRYRWAAGDLGSTWIGFDPLDLTGLRMSAGINVVF
jgi:hypothetical protein